MNPRYPIYIPSKGRWQTRKTMKALDSMGVPYWVVIEPQEHDQYAAVINPKRLLVLPFSNLGQGSIPARNWIFEHALTMGAERHWCIDDNIFQFSRLHKNRIVRATSGTVFRCAEDFTDRWKNVALSGLGYEMFAPERNPDVPPIVLNTRIYSTILLNSSISYRWRGKYNEDTDLSLRCLKDGWCTIQFMAFLARKPLTQTVPGGNTSEVYVDGDNRRKFAESLKAQHPDVVTVKWKFGRWHHEVNYRPFKDNKLIPVDGLKVKPGTDDYGMKLRKIKK